MGWTMKEHDLLPTTRELFESRFARFVKDLAKYEREQLIRERQDEFLDAYSRWIKLKSTALKHRVLAIARQLEILDPSFRFDLP